MNKDKQSFTAGSVLDDGIHLIIRRKEEPEFYALGQTGQGKEVKVGDTVECNPVGENFGWFIPKS